MRREILENMINSKRNNIISGDSMVGKTTNIGYGLVKKIIEKGENLFILDTKEEYINKFSELLTDKGYNIIVINTKNPLKSCGWNPFEYSFNLYSNGFKDDSVKYLNSLSEVLFADDLSTDPFWENMASDFFKGIVLMLYQIALKEEINFRSINSLISEADIDIKFLEEYFKTIDKNNLAYICASSTIFSPIETRGGIMTMTMSKLNKLVRKDSLSSLLNKTTYDINEVLNQKTAIFFVADEMEDISVLGTIYIKELFNIICSRKREKRFNFILDNFDYLDVIKGFKAMLSLSGSNNIKFHLFTRDKANIEKDYSTYINKLSNNIFIDDLKIVVEIGSVAKVIENKFIVDKTKIKEFNYPTLEEQEIKLFNFKKYVLNNIKVEMKDYSDYKLEIGDMKIYDEIKGVKDNPQRRALVENNAKFYVVKKDGEIVKHFVLFNAENWLAVDNKDLLDINYLNFILDNIEGYDYVTVYVPGTAEHIVNTLKFNFDIESIEEENFNEYITKKIIIKNI